MQRKRNGSALSKSDGENAMRKKINQEREITTPSRKFVKSGLGLKTPNNLMAIRYADICPTIRRKGRNPVYKCTL